MSNAPTPSSKYNGYIVARDLSAIWLQAVVAILLFVFFPSVFTFMIAAFLIGGAQHGMGLVAHEGAHWLLLPRNRKLNDWVTFLFFTSPILLPIGLYRERHFAHHRETCTDHDTKFLYRRNLRGIHFLKEIFLSLVGLDYVIQVIGVLIRRQSDHRQDSGSFSKFILEVSAMIAVQLVIFGVFWAAGVAQLYFLLWLLPLFTTTVLFSKLRSAVEHQPVVPSAEGGRFFKGTERPFVRTVRPLLWERLFFSKINFSYHLEHHTWPQSSYLELPGLYERASESKARFSSEIACSYTSALARLVAHSR